MRRIAVTIAFLISGLGCTETWVLPGAAVDGGRRDGETAASGGRSGHQGSGGVFGQAGRGGLGTGGAGGRSMCNGPVVPVTIDRQKADLLFSVGRNASMSAPFGNGTRMSVVQQKLREVIAANQNAVNFAYQDFPSASSCQNQIGTVCCANGFPVYPKPRNSGDIDRSMRQCEPFAPVVDACVSVSDSRPIADALKSAIAATPSLSSPILKGMGDRYFVLIVDGPPGCAAQENASSSCTNALSQASELARAEIEVLVVPVGEDAEKNQCLQDLANAGTASQPFSYPARNSEQLTKSLADIVRRAAPKACSLNLLTTVGRGIELYIMNRPVPMNSQDGWAYVAGSDRKIEIRGSWCEMLQSTDGPIEAFTCP